MMYKSAVKATSIRLGCFQKLLSWLAENKNKLFDWLTEKLALPLTSSPPRQPPFKIINDLVRFKTRKRSTHPISNLTFTLKFDATISCTRCAQFHGHSAVLWQCHSNAVGKVWFNGWFSNGLNCMMRSYLYP
jgi:hypothetical protein